MGGLILKTSTWFLDLRHHWASSAVCIQDPCESKCSKKTQNNKELQIFSLVEEPTVCKRGKVGNVEQDWDEGLWINVK